MDAAGSTSELEDSKARTLAASRAHWSLVAPPTRGPWRYRAGHRQECDVGLPRRCLPITKRRSKQAINPVETDTSRSELQQLAGYAPSCGVSPSTCIS